MIWLFGLSLGVAALSGGLIPSTTLADRPGSPSVPSLHSINRDPTQIAGPDACAECHENEHRVWMESAHQANAMTLSRDAEAKRIAKVMGVRRIKTDERCSVCHYTIQKIEGKRLKSISGVSCESCHNAGTSWIDTHSQFGPDAAAADDESPQHRADRLEYCDSMGMVRPARLYELAIACYSCHAITDQELVHAAGHPSGDGFEFASWTQSEIRHNFVRAGSDENPRSEPDRVRVMHLIGAAVRLEFACRAVVDGAALDVITSAVAELETIDNATTIDVVSELIEIGLSVENASDALSAAPLVQAIGISIGENRIGSDEDGLDALIPDSPILGER